MIIDIVYSHIKVINKNYFLIVVNLVFLNTEND